METLEQILAKAESKGWSVSLEKEPAGTKEGWRHEERNYVKLKKFSPAGEDFSMSIDFTQENPKETFLLNLKKYLDSFDVDRHAEKWIPQRGKGGCPDSILDLLTDAEQIRHSIFDLWSFLSGGQPFGVLNTQLSALLKETETLLTFAPSEKECSREENQVFADLANLKESLTRTRIVAEEG